MAQGRDLVGKRARRKKAAPDSPRGAVPHAESRPTGAQGLVGGASGLAWGDSPRLAGWLLRAEQRIALLEATIPENARVERSRVIAAWQSGHVTLPRWELPSRPSLAELRRELDRLASEEPKTPLGALYAARAEELGLEAALVEARGTARFASLARRRFPLTRQEEERSCALAQRWLSAAGDGHGVVATADALVAEKRCSATDLAQAFVERIRELGLVARVEVRAGLAVTAAVGEGIVLVAEDAALGADQVARIVRHEVEGHLLPRARALGEGLGLLRVGSAGAGEDEEGRALLLEERYGHLDEATAAGRARRRELALRHLAADAARRGADFVELMRFALEAGEPIPSAYRLTERVLRGGGLAREVCYLPALERVREGFREEPELEAWLLRGRLSVEAARVLRRLALSR